MKERGRESEEEEKRERIVFTLLVLRVLCQMQTDALIDIINIEETLAKCDSMTLSSAPPLRRGSTPVPIKHQLRREEAVHDDCDWTSGLAGPSPPPISFSPAKDETIASPPSGPFRIALLGQNGVGKSSLAIALAGDLDRTASVDSEGEGYVRTVTVDDEDCTILIYDNWRQDLSALQCEVCVLVFSVTDRRSFHRTAQLRLLLRETQPQTPIILVGNKSDLVRSREVSTQEAFTSATLFDCLYVEMSTSLDHRTVELLESAVRLARGLSPVPPGAYGHDMAGGLESITHRAKRFLASLVPRYPRERERDGGKFFRQKSRSCHDLGAL
uniref:RRAD and GEM like GTPase 2 n=2 Tax=Hucho hucho TaxID=62062 RepID=A0A4W5PG02_9TELE